MSIIQLTVSDERGMNPVTIYLINPLTLSQTSPGFYLSADKSLENTVEKGEIARDKQFLLFPQCFLHIFRTSCHLHEIENCCQKNSFSLKESKKRIADWERVKEIGQAKPRIKPGISCMQELCVTEKSGLSPHLLRHGFLCIRSTIASARSFFTNFCFNWF